MYECRAIGSDPVLNNALFDNVAHPMYRDILQAIRGNPERWRESSNQAQILKHIAMRLSDLAIGEYGDEAPCAERLWGIALAFHDRISMPQAENLDQVPVQPTGAALSGNLLQNDVR